MNFSVSCLALAFIVGGAFAKTAAAQLIGGRYAVGFLSLPPSATTSALGGWQLREDTRDPGLAQFNPATLNAETDRVVHVGQDFMFAGVGRSSLAGGKHIERLGIDAAAHLQYVGFGDFVGRDAAGVETGDFGVRGYSVGVSAGRELFERLRVGAGLSLVQQQIESYRAFGLSLSGGLVYSPDTSGRTLIGLQFQHLGTLINDFDAASEPLPIDVSIGLTRRLKYLPVRFGILYRKLDRWDLLYDDPDRRDAGGFGEEPTERSGVSRAIDNFGRHLAFNVELGLGSRDELRLRVGYDRQRQAENLVQGSEGNYPSLAGFGGGLGFDFRRGQVNYAYRVQHQGGAANHLTLLVDLDPGERAANPERAAKPKGKPVPRGRRPVRRPRSRASEADRDVAPESSDPPLNPSSAAEMAERPSATPAPTVPGSASDTKYEETDRKAEKAQRKAAKKERLRAQRERREALIRERRRGSGKPEGDGGPTGAKR